MKSSKKYWWKIFMIFPGFRIISGMWIWLSIVWQYTRAAITRVKANSEEFKVLSEFAVEYGEGPRWSHPSIYHG